MLSFIVHFVASAQMRPIAESNYIVLINVVALLHILSILTIVSAFGGFSTIIRSQNQATPGYTASSAHTYNECIVCGDAVASTAALSVCSMPCTLPTYWF